MALLIRADGIRCRTSATSSAQGHGAVLGVMLPQTCSGRDLDNSYANTCYKNTRSVPRVAARSNRAFQASAGVAQRYPSAQPLAWPRALTHGLARSHAQRRAARARAWRQPRCARVTQLRWARPRQALRWARTRASQSSGRTPAIDIVPLIARYPPACLPTQTTS